MNIYAIFVWPFSPLQDWDPLKATKDAYYSPAIHP